MTITLTTAQVEQLHTFAIDNGDGTDVTIDINGGIAIFTQSNVEVQYLHDGEEHKPPPPMKRKVFEMSPAQLDKILDASKPTPAMFLSGGQSIAGTPQENANYAWRELADELGFDWETVQPIPGMDQRHFTAMAPVED